MDPRIRSGGDDEGSGGNDEGECARVKDPGRSMSPGFCQSFSTPLNRGGAERQEGASLVCGHLTGAPRAGFFHRTCTSSPGEEPSYSHRRQGHSAPGLHAPRPGRISSLRSFCLTPFASIVLKQAIGVRTNKKLLRRNRSLLPQIKTVSSRVPMWRRDGAENKGGKPSGDKFLKSEAQPRQGRTAAARLWPQVAYRR